jgi:CDP-diacylglycerol--serine O-phosphatidyltransferase
VNDIANLDETAVDDSPPAEKRQRFSMLRSYTMADVFTLSNAACGTVSIFLCLNYLDLGNPQFIWIAFLLIPIALIFDALDGWVARKRQAWSILGADLDSLADVVSFGVAPAVIGFTLGLRGIWDMIFLVYFVVCGISRLARFNVTAADLADASTGKVKYFEGTPIPTSVVLVAVLAALTQQCNVGIELMWGGMTRIAGGMFHPLSLMFFVSGSLMISTIKIPKP